MSLGGLWIWVSFRAKTALNSEVSCCNFTCSELKIINIQIILNTAQLRKILNALAANTHSSTLPFYPQIPAFFLVTIGFVCLGFEVAAQRK